MCSPFWHRILKFEFLDDKICVFGITKLATFKLINHVNGLLLRVLEDFPGEPIEVIKVWNFHHSPHNLGKGKVMFELITKGKMIESVMPR